MEAWEVLASAIPPAASKRVAQLLGITADYVRRWRREPESDEAPSGSGQRSILDRVCDLIDAVFLVNPTGTALIVNYINGHYRKLMRTHALPINSYEDCADTVEDLLVQTTEAVNRLNRDGCTEQTLKELVDMRNAATAAIERVEKTMKEAIDA